MRRGWRSSSRGNVHHEACGEDGEVPQGPGGEGVEMVRISVRMTRAMYAQLMEQNFQVPRGYPMPRREEGQEKWKEAELGMKIACGFEMMYQERRRQGEEGKGSTWEVYRKSLEATGCFKVLLPGSKEYKRVMEDAMQYYKRSTLFSRSRRDMESVDLDVNQFIKAMESVLGGGSKEQADNDGEFDRRSSSSDMDFDDSDEENVFAEEFGDKEMSDAFMESYSDALNKELSSTTIEKSFVRAPRPVTNNEGPSDATGTDGEMTPVDVDLNLVESILNSYSSQQGLPGPTSNLLGRMGVKVPPDAKKS